MQQIEQKQSGKTSQKNELPNELHRQRAVSSMLFIVIASIAGYLHYSRDEQPFKPYIDTSSYYVQQNPKIYAGEIHYARIPVEYWQHRIMMIKAMGLNSLSVYIMWNYHEIEKGRFDFQTENRNLTLFLELAEKYEMKVLIRPGPYVCAEWDFGGLPARLLADPEIKIRSKQPKFMQEVRLYFSEVALRIKNHIWSIQNPNKCIIMLQIENEYGFFGSDVDYIRDLRRMWRNLGIITSQYYVEWIINVRKSHWQGANIGLNDAFTQIQIDYIKTTLEPKGLVFGGEIYSGWLTFWHLEDFVLIDPHERVKQYEFLMSHNLSYAMYVAHGGTSFGLTAGSNNRYVENLGFSGQLTSYDYDAPINQQGAATYKYQIFRQSIKKYASWQVPQVPDNITMKKIPPFKVLAHNSLFDNIDWKKPKAISKKPLVYQSKQLQMFHQGLVVYQIELPPGFNDMYMIQSHDITYISIDGKYNITLDRTFEKHPTITLKCESDVPCVVRFLVDAMGHINYDLSMKDDFKGIVQFKSLSNNDHEFEWKIYTIPIHDMKLLSWTNLGQNLLQFPVVLKTILVIEEPADTYLNMKKFGKGFVWVNGRNLGRYWNAGPQLKLFCPGVWLKKGENTIEVLDLFYSGEHVIWGELTLKEMQSQF